MFHLPHFRRIKDGESLAYYASEYADCSGLPVPRNYLQASENHVFGIFWKKQLIGGFILGAQANFRSLQCFAKEDQHAALQLQMGAADQYSEICCFFIKSQYRTHMKLNLFVWLSLTYAIRRFGRTKLLFGTNKVPLARLYGQTHRSRPFHEDRINGQRTFLFVSERKHSVRGMLEIIRFKIKRFRRIQRRATAC